MEEKVTENVVETQDETTTENVVEVQEETVTEKVAEVQEEKTEENVVEVQEETTAEDVATTKETATETATEEKDNASDTNVREEKTAKAATGNMEDLGKDLEKSYAYMGNGEYDTDTLLAWEKINKYKETKEILTVKISGIVNKGVIALVEGVRGFIPVSRLDINHVEDTNEWLDKEVRVRVIDANMEKGKLVLSAREILREESAVARRARREQAISKIEVGSVVEGKVESLQPYGAFIDLGDGISGLVHISQISYNRISSPKEALEPGQTVKAKVIKNEGGKISLSIKALLEEQRVQEEKEIKNNIPKVESIGTSLGSLLKGIKLDN